MSLITAPGDRPVHFPANPNAFGFDAEVSRIFPDMAGRAIPNFYASHEAHAEMLKTMGVPNTASILDIGASRGAFFNALRTVYGRDERFRLHAIDNSPDMCAYLGQDYPGCDIQCRDITEPAFLKGKDTYDVVCAHYVLQFVPMEEQDEVLRAIFAKVKPGGVLIYGHKSEHLGKLGKAAHEQYIDFRVENGYSREEIAAKTKALKGSMYPTDHEILLSGVRYHFREVQETFRFMMFSTFMAVK